MQQHKYHKELADVEFFVDYNEAKASVYWIKRDQLLIKKGAQLLKEPPLLKDGSLGFAAKFTNALRSEYSDCINEDYITTKDIILKSVNEVGNFLYYAGTNSWLVLKDKDGKTIQEYSM